MIRGKDNHAGLRILSPITRRILAVNVLALAILVAGMLFSGEYRTNLIEAELEAMHIKGQMFAAALGETATTSDAPVGSERPGRQFLSSDIPHVVRRLAETTLTRARLFAPDGVMLADSRQLLGPGGVVQVEELPPPEAHGGVFNPLLAIFDRLARRFEGLDQLPPYREAPLQKASDYPEVRSTFSGEAAQFLRTLPDGTMMLSISVPVQRYKQVLGALMLSRDSHNIEAAVYDLRLNILSIFAVALAVTVLLSLYLAGTIARPIRRLAVAAERVRRGHHRQHRIPNFDGRNDEIGELARALSDMTEALWLRMDAIEGFAADVAHEIKNPLTSLQSAVETAARVTDPEQQKILMAIIQDDVTRLDRLISDISDASRLDAELSKAEEAPVDIGRMLGTMVDLHASSASDRSVRIEMEEMLTGDCVVQGLEGRMVQVFRNLIANAISFSPEGGVIKLSIDKLADGIEVIIEDDGPGIPADKEDAIFDRFYTERPEGEKFGSHSGLGLSISRQIVEAHDGRMTAENRRGKDDVMMGARFRVWLPFD